MEQLDNTQSYDKLDELYDIWCAEVTEDIPFYVDLAASLARELGKDTLKIVELGAGSGRVTIPLLSMGHNVTAIDTSKKQLDRLQSKSADTSGKLEVIVADMLDIAKLLNKGEYDLVIAPFRCLLHVTSSRDQLFTDVNKVLNHKGVFAFDVFHATPDQSLSIDGRWVHRRSQDVPEGTWSFYERTTYSPSPPNDDTSSEVLTLDLRCRFKNKDRTKSDEDQEKVISLKLYLTTADQWYRSLLEAGFSLDAAYGWFDARPLSDTDTDSVWVARSGQG